NVTTPGINFNLTPGARIAGRVLYNNSCCIAGVAVEFYNASSRLVARATTDVNGSFLSDAGVPNGTYYGRTRTPNTGLLDVSYGGLNCYGDNGNGTDNGSCNLMATTGIVVRLAPQPRAGVDFNMRSSG